MKAERAPIIDVYGHPDLPPCWEEAVLLIDKPKGWSSFDVIRKLRRILPIRKIGHAGTLDPMATGLLVCLIGKATKQMEQFMGLPKCYTGTLRLGAVTPSYDAETEARAPCSWEHLTWDDLERARLHFEGEVIQVPPMYSAVKVKGERLYKKARRGEVVERPPRVVHLTRFSLQQWEGPDITFEVDCSKGTYVRSLAHDFGQKLGVGAHLVALRRTAIGPYQVGRAWMPETLVEALNERAKEL